MKKLLILLLASTPATAHEAPKGWLYEGSCCAGDDCQQVDSSVMHIVPGGIALVMKAGDHKKLESDITFDATRVLKRSKDEFLHVCLIKMATPKQWQPTPDQDRDYVYMKAADGSWYRLLCVYIPKENG
jgi:hypothetical protein